MMIFPIKTNKWKEQLSENMDFSTLWCKIETTGTNDQQDLAINNPKQTFEYTSWLKKNDSVNLVRWTMSVSLLTLLYSACSIGRVNSFILYFLWN